VLRELFNAALIGFVDNPSTQQPVAEVKMDPVGAFAPPGAEARGAASEQRAKRP
jgi:hypothetical protein